MAENRRPLSEQVMVITGATSGIGLATARLAAQKGAAVVLAARNSQALSQIEADLRAQGHKALAVPTDVTSRAEIKRLADAAEREFGRIDTWVNNAGASLFGKLTEVSDEDSRALREVNFWGLVYASLEAVDRMRTNGGTLINLGSVTSDITIPIQSMYSTTKHAVKGFTDGLRMELAADGVPITVTLIKPASVDTPLPEHARNYMSVQPKLPEPLSAPEDVAEAIVKAAVHGGRDVYVGMAAPVFTTLHAVMPSLLDWLGRTVLISRQRTSRPAHTAAGNLARPGSGGHAHGKEGAIPTSRRSWAVPLTLGLLGVGILSLMQFEKKS